MSSGIGSCSITFLERFLLKSISNNFQNFLLTHFVALFLSRHNHYFPDKTRDHAGGAGVREGRHIPAGPTAAGWGQGSRHLLRLALHRVLREGRPQDHHTWRPSTGGQIDSNNSEPKFRTKKMINSLRCDWRCLS